MAVVSTLTGQFDVAQRLFFLSSEAGLLNERRIFFYRRSPLWLNTKMAEHKLSNHRGRSVKYTVSGMAQGGNYPDRSKSYL